MKVLEKLLKWKTKEKITYASDKKVEKATKFVIEKYRDDLKELAKY